MNWMPREVAADHGGEAADGQRLGDAGHALEQAVALGQQADHQLLDHVLLADDHPLDLGDGLAEQLGGPLVARSRCPTGHSVLAAGGLLTAAVGLLQAAPGPGWPYDGLLKLDLLA